MKLQKLFLTVVVLHLCCITKAVPAYPGLISRQQPDGTTLFVRLHGDEYLCFTTTEDGYTIKKRDDGFYCYARLNANGQLEPTDCVAHDIEERTASERQWLQGVGKYLAPAMSASAAARRRADQDLQNRARAAAQAKAPLFNYGNFHGLIILAEFNDRKFSREDYPEMAERMMNQKDYHGYGLGQYEVFTGSVRDYFYDNSMGVFDPQFDIVGPITVDVSEEFPQQTKNSSQLMMYVADAADKDVDFSKYDLDGDGVVDMVYIIFAGYGSHVSGDDNSNLLWAHAGYFYDLNTWGYLYKDNVRLGRYACSTEMEGIEGDKYFDFIDGIGTICHEFSHVLGLPDLYDTNYEKDGQSADPGDWSIMSGGCYQNNGRTPPGYTLYERYSLGFATPEVITKEGSYQLEPLAESNFGYRLDTQVDNEFFLIENRQISSKWDQYLPGHGMLVFRVDSTNTNAWNNNMVNCDANHNYFELVAAGGKKNKGYSSSDPFPGKNNVTALNNNTSPANLLTWSGTPSLLGFENITEENGIITFNVVEGEAPAGIRSVSLNGLDASTPAAVYTTDGHLIARTTVGRLNALSLRRGVYIVKTTANICRYIFL